MFKRYAIFYTPPPGDWADFCAAWLGWDSVHGKATAHPYLPGLNVAELTAIPRKYGVHATMKAPFYLAETRSVEGLTQSFDTLCKTLAPVMLDGLQLSRLNRFIAVTPLGDVADLQALQTRVVQDLDDYRAPLSEQDLARRRAASLTAKQDQYLIQWGYPYIMDEFRFHITLTGQLQDALAETVQDALEPRMASLLPKPFAINHLTLLGEDDAGLFHHIHHCALTG